MPRGGVGTTNHLHSRRTDGVIVMARDAVVEETRRIRDRFAKAHGYDVRRIARALQQEEAKSGRKLVTLPAKKVRQKSANVG